MAKPRHDIANGNRVKASMALAIDSIKKERQLAATRLERPKHITRMI